MSSSTDCGDRTPPAKRPRTATRCLQKDLFKWSAKDVQVFLNDHGLERVAAKMNGTFTTPRRQVYLFDNHRVYFAEHGVTGLELATLSSQDMAKMEIRSVKALSGL